MLHLAATGKAETCPFGEYDPVGMRPARHLRSGALIDRKLSAMQSLHAQTLEVVRPL